MEILKKENFLLLKSLGKSIKECYDFIIKSDNKLKNNHLIIDFSDIINIDIEDLLLFLNIGIEKRKNGTSFVIISKDVDIDKIPDEINIAPTLEEAIDILEMEEIQRDLGF